jgi:D-alanyl-lipoteichoic acid acyltransferase DltB (MBOAT superfamily)
MVSAASLLGRAPDAFLVWHIVLPVAISFYIFEAIAYNVDVYRRQVPAVWSIIDFSLFISFFPHLAAGPIIRPALFFPQLRHRHIPSDAEIGWGSVQVLKGLLKKAVFADNFALIANAYFNENVGHAGRVGAWVGILAFSMQIYFDFSGYTDVARGCAMLLGFRFPPNFQRPYLSANIAAFWQRWHISLSTWLRDYLYIPIGGSRRGTARTYFNLMLTMGLGGLWHGASWNFVAWGVYHGVLLVSHRGWQAARDGREGGVVWKAMGTCLTFVLVTLGWVTFRAPDFATTLNVFGDLFFGGAGLHAAIPAQMMWMLLCCGCWLILDRDRRLQTWLANGQGVAGSLKMASALAVCLLVMELFAPVNATVPFIYFRF